MDAGTSRWQDPEPPAARTGRSPVSAWPVSTLDAEEVRRRADVFEQAQADMLVRQTRTGTVAASITAAALALVLGHGPLRLAWFGWAVAVVLSFLARDAAVRWIQRAAVGPARVLEFTGWISALLAVIISLPAPLLFPMMSDLDRGVFFAVITSWMAVAALVNGLHPPSYRVYLLICSLGLSAGWWRAVPAWQAGWLTLMLATGAFMLSQFSRRLCGLLVESVGIRDENARLVRQLERALEDTESAQRARSRFLAAASHDLLQPVHALMLLSGLIRRVQPAKRDEVARRIELTAEAVDAMFRGLLDLARIDAGTLVAQRVGVSLPVVCEAVRGAYESRCAEAGLSLTVACPGSLHAWGDPALLDRVLRNLVDNAVKFTREGGVRVACAAQGPHAVLTVSDTGEGIDGEDLQQICAPFFRGRGAREGGVEGLGLGLAITVHMVHQMQGTITIDSVRGRGTTVRVQLPLAPSTGAVAHSTQGSCRPLRYRRVVLIEDDRLANQATRLWLEGHGAEVVACLNVDDALRACRERGWTPPDFILADFLLGDDDDGLQGIALLREALGWCPATLVSGENLEPSLLPGDVSFLSKPLKPERLEALLAEPENLGA